MLTPGEFPNRITIGNHEYTVVFVGELDKAYAGLCYPDSRKTILISTKQSKEQMLATFWHEVLHAIEAEFNVKLGHRKINKLEWALAQVHLQFYKEKD